MDNSSDPPPIPCTSAQDGTGCGGMIKGKPKGVGGFHPLPPLISPHLCGEMAACQRGNQKVWEVSTSHTKNSLYLYLVQVQVVVRECSVTKGNKREWGTFRLPHRKWRRNPRCVGILRLPE
uniref:Uncharacterized protein n=1 Tax=Meloidogyne enterolobii TaxID=390850 RepID=A0A6V7UX81_MELEN|nr:unnamed protein product [Meloidogyne enterolobii]